MRKTTPLLRIFTIVYLFSFAADSFAQADTGYYFFKEDFSYTGDTNAVNAGITTKIKDDSAWRLTVTNKITNKIVMKGAYLANFLERPHGPFEYYYEDGTPLKMGSYHDGKETGLWQSWNHTGKLLDSFVFKEGEAILFARRSYYDDGKLSTYSHVDMATSESIENSYDRNGKLTEESVFLGYAGQTKRYYPNTQTSQVIVFDNAGNKKSINYYKEGGKEISEKQFLKAQETNLKAAIEELNTTLPEFRGGIYSFEWFFQRYFVLPKVYKGNTVAMMRIEFSLTLNEKGEPNSIRMINPTDAELQRAISEVIRLMPPWDMKGHKSWGPVKRILEIRAYQVKVSDEALL